MQFYFAEIILQENNLDFFVFDFFDELERQDLDICLFLKDEF